MSDISIKHWGESIQEAIDRCRASGGGRVVLEAGVYISGTIRLKSHVTLYLERGALLLGSDRIEDYPENETCFTDAVGHRRGKALLYAYDAEEIGIAGEGVIDGRGGVFGPEHPAHLERPFLVRLCGCRQVRIQGICLRQSAAWGLHMQACTGVRVEGVQIINRCNANNDGIDIDSCSKVEISRCIIDSGDDALCLKTTSQNPCEEIHISDCVVTSDWAALKIGTESAGDFRGIEAERCIFYDVRGCGIKVVPVDGGTVSGLSIHDIEMRNCTGPIFFSTGRRLRDYYGEKRTSPGQIRHVILKRIKAQVVSARGGFYQGKPWGNAKGCVVFSGLEELPIEDLRIQDCEIELPGGVYEAYDGPVPQMGEQYPEFHLFDPLPCWGLYLRHVRRLSLRNVRLTKRGEDVRPMRKEEDVTDVSEG